MRVDIQKVMKAYREAHGEASFGSPSEILRLRMPRISTGIFYLDVATGGGIPVGRTSLIYGQPSAGKSSLCAKVIANAQRTCRQCFGQTVMEEVEVPYKTAEVDPTGKIVNVTKKKKKLVPVDCVNKCRDADEEGGKKEWPGRMNIVHLDAEGTFDPVFYSKFGVDCDKDSGLYLCISDYGEAAIDAADAAIRTGGIDLLIVDTIVHLIPKKEREDSTEEASFGTGQAKLLNKMHKLLTASLNEVQARYKTDCTVILVNQIRQKIGLFPGMVIPGGKGQEFVSSLDIRLFQKDMKKSMDTEGIPLWQETQFVIEKSKVCPPKREGKYRMCIKSHPGRNPGDTWDDEVVADAATDEGFVIKKDGKYFVFDKPYDSEAAIREEVSKKGELYYNLRAGLLDLFNERPSDGVLSKKGKDEE